MVVVVCLRRGEEGQVVAAVRVQVREQRNLREQPRGGHVRAQDQGPCDGVTFIGS